MTEQHDDARTVVLARGQNIKHAYIMVLRSQDPEAQPDKWEPVMRDDVPDWVKNDPEVMGNIINGQVVHNDTQGGFWYRAEKTGQVH